VHGRDREDEQASRGAENEPAPELADGQ